MPHSHTGFLPSLYGLCGGERLPIELWVKAYYFLQQVIEIYCMKKPIIFHNNKYLKFIVLPMRGQTKS